MCQRSSTIRVCPGSYGPITVSLSIAVIGAGDGVNTASNTILDAQNSGRVTLVNPGITVTLRRLRFTGGNTISSGGGIANDGTLTVLGCTVTGNHAYSLGGGINNGGTLTLTGCTVSTNTSGNGVGIASNGTGDGATVTLTDCQITGNTATKANDGGILNEASRGMLTLQNGSSVTGNTPSNCVGCAQ